MGYRWFSVFLLTLAIASHVQSDYADNEVQDGEGRSFSDDLDFLDSYLDEKNTNVEATQKIEDVAAVEEPIVVTSRAPCLGCPQAIDAKDDKIKEMALFAYGDYLTKHKDQIGSDDEDLMEMFVRVLKAERQIVAGVKYILEVELGWSNCSKSQYREGPEESCPLDTSKPTFTCDFHVVEKAWENSKEVVHGNCHKDETTPDNDGVAPTLDDDTEVDLEDTIVADDSDTDDSQRRRKRQAKFGQARGAEEDHEKLMEIAKFAVEQLDQVDEDNLARLVVDILNANKQTVSGWLYHLKIRVAQTSCEENSGATLEKCKDKITLPFQRCEVKVLFQPWQTVQKKLVQSQCTRENYKTSKKVAKQLFGTLEKRSKRMQQPLIGEGKVLDPESEDIAELVNFAIDSVDLMSNALHAQKLVRVVYAERKLVSGVSTKLVLELGYTKCRKEPELDKSTCSIDEERDHQYCNVTIVQKVWKNETKMVSSKCGKREEVMEQTRRKRDSSVAILIDEDEELDEDSIEFGRFMETYGKNYSPEEYQYRLAIFKDNMEKVRLLQKTEQGTAVYGSTMFADLTEEEFSTRHLGFRVDLKQRMKRKQAKIPLHHLRNLPDAFDWRNFSAVTPVKNQGSCGSCWAFSVTGNIEGIYAVKHKNLVSFSEQELVDCDKMDDGCNGGLPENAYKALEKLGGLETEGDYPYDGHNDKCHFNSTLVAAKVTGFVEVSKNETEIAAFLVKNGPVSIGINANAMQFYFGGVSHPWKFLCSPKNLDHGVLIVGYGVHATRKKSVPYWIVKNSWGTSWGEKGYYRIFRGDGSCGLNQMTTSAYVA